MEQVKCSDTAAAQGLREQITKLTDELASAETCAKRLDQGKQQNRKRVQAALGHD